MAPILVISAIEQNQAVILAVTALTLVFLIVLNVTLWVRVVKINNRIGKLLRSTQTDSLEEQLQVYNQRVEENTGILRTQQTAIEQIQHWQPMVVQNVGVVRFNAFDDVGSDLSFAVAILDCLGNGVVLSSIYGREDSRIFAKPVKDGRSSYRLSGEEDKAIGLALGKWDEPGGENEKKGTQEK